MKENLPILLLKKLVLFPNQEILLEINNDVSKSGIDDAIKNYNSNILVIIASLNPSSIFFKESINKV